MSSRRNPRDTSHSSDSKRYFDWLFYAKLDYLAAKNLIQDERCYPAAAFHCQQAIEKSLKAYLLFNTQRLFDGHNLTWLCKQAMLVDTVFTQWLQKSTALNKFYIETRYPADIPFDIDTETIDNIFFATTEMLDFISGQIRFDFQRYNKKKRKLLKPDCDNLAK